MSKHLSAFQENFAKFSSSESEDEPNSDTEASAVLEMWFYRDPMGKDQGPFPPSKLLQWEKYFDRKMPVWRYGSDRRMTFGDFLQEHKVVPLWTYIDEENEPLLDKGGHEQADSDTDNERYNDDYDIHSTKEININIDKMDIKAANNSKSLPEIETVEQGACAQVEKIEEVVKEHKFNDVKTEIFSEKFENSFDDSEDSLDDFKKSKKLPAKKGIDVDVGVNDIVPDVYEKFDKVQKLTPMNPLDYVPYQRDQEIAAKKREKENIEPIEEIPSNKSFYDMSSGYQGMTNLGGYGVNRAPFPGQFLSYYRHIPPPLPINLSNPPPSMWNAPPNSHHRLPMLPNFAPINFPPSQFYAAQAQNQHQMTYYGNQMQGGYPPNTTTANNLPQKPYPEHNKYYHNQQGIGQELQPVYNQNYPNNTNNMGSFCQNLIEKYIDVTGQKFQQLYQENHHLKLHNEQLKKQTTEKSKAVDYKGMPFAKMVSMNQGEDGKTETKSFWDNMPPPQPPTAPQKKVNKYPAGYVGEGTKKKQEKSKDGIEEFIEWCLATLIYISENKLNIEGLRVVLKDLESIAFVERYIKMWLEEINPKMWHLFSEKLKKYRKEGSSDELNSPARANPYDVEKQKQKEKLQKKTELFPSTKDLNTANINRHLTKINQTGKK